MLLPATMPVVKVLVPAEVHVEKAKINV